MWLLEEGTWGNHVLEFRHHRTTCDCHGHSITDLRPGYPAICSQHKNLIYFERAGFYHLALGQRREDTFQDGYGEWNRSNKDY